MQTQKLKILVEEAFPFVDKPKGLDLSFHKDDCSHCHFLRKALESHVSRELSASGIREIFSEMSCLSSEGWLWVFPAYLRLCLKQNASAQSDETEFLIYNLGPSTEFEEETKQRLSGFNRKQLACLLAFVNWLQENEYWSSYCGKELAVAKTFLSSLVNA